MSASDLSVQQQRWNTWMDKASQMKEGRVVYRTFWFKSTQASHLRTTLPTGLGGLVAVFLLAMPMVCVFSCDMDGNIDYASTSFIAGTTTVASLYFLSIFAAYRFVSEHKREILEDTDEKGPGLYERTLQLDAPNSTGEELTEISKSAT